MITDAFCEQEPIFRIFLVGGDAYIAPWGTTPEQSGKTDTPVPSAPGPMWATAPTKIQVSNVCVFLVAYFKPLTFVSLYATMRLRDELVVSKATEVIRCTYCRKLIFALFAVLSKKFPKAN